MASWLIRALQDGDTPSSARLLMCGTFVMSWIWISYSLFHLHKWPDGTTFTGLATLCTAPYLVNRASVVFEKTQSDVTNAPDGRSQG